MKLTSDDLMILAVPAIATVLVVGFFIWAIHAINADNKAWAEFTASHVCERTERTKSGYYIISIVNNVPIMTWVPGQMAWDCDNGKSYWRDE